MLSNFLYYLHFKLRLEGQFLSNNYPPGHRLHLSGVVIKDSGEFVVKNFYGKVVLRFGSVKSLYKCLKSRKYQLIVARYLL
ncbi:hypothetical protein [Vibrio phage vB_VpaP_SJSY21]|nr:hypothetical protein [Vibrio phage vB_VpaP_SJSY21]